MTGKDVVMTLQALVRGANVPLPDEVRRVRVVVGWANDDVDVDASALLLSSGGQVRDDEDFIFYNQPLSSDGAVQHLGRVVAERGAEERLSIDLDEISDDVETIAVTASVHEGTFGGLGGMRFSVLDESAVAVAHFDIADATTETAFLFGEVYRRAGAWKVRAVGQGWDSGLAGLATDFGVSVADDSEAEVVDELEPVPIPAQVSEGHEDELVEVEERVEDAAPVLAVPTTGDPAAGTIVGPAVSVPSRAAKGVRTRKQRAVVAVPVLRLADDEAWVPSRLFSVYGVGANDEQEKRATSALLSIMMGVRPFARSVCAHLGAPAGAVETYLEVPFILGDRKVIPDGVIRVARAGKVWTALLEVKTGSGQLRKEQIEHYLDVARSHDFDAVVTLSNEIAPGSGEHPVDVDARKLRSGVSLFHLSWAEIVHEAQMVLTHRGVADPGQAWMLHELIRYLEHPRSGATGFEDMGASWVAVREAVAAGTLRAGDSKVPAVASSWNRLVRQLCLRLTAELGVPVTHVLARKYATDPAARSRATVEQLADTGSLSATLKIPGAAGMVTVLADLRTSRVRVSALIAAPQEGGAQRRISWLLRQVKDAPDDTLVDVHYSGSAQDTCERLADVRDRPVALVSERSGDVASFELTAVAPMGTKRSGLKGAFIPSVITATEAFYSAVLQPLRPWVAPAPRLAGDVDDPEPGTLKDR